MTINFIRQKIKPGMSLPEVDAILNRHHFRYRDNRYEVEIDCAKVGNPSSQIMKSLDGRCFEKVKYCASITVGDMGPVFMHNDFRINFDAHGRVIMVTPVRHWD